MKPYKIPESVLVVIHTADLQVLLIERADRPGYWQSVTGSLDAADEPLPDAAARELFEETGLTGIALGEPVWSHDFTVEWDAADHDTGHAVFYTATVDPFEPSNSNWTEDEHVDVLEHRWWSLAELLATTEAYEPRELINLVRRQLPSC